MDEDVVRDEGAVAETGEPPGAPGVAEPPASPEAAPVSALPIAAELATGAVARTVAPGGELRLWSDATPAELRVVDPTTGALMELTPEVRRGLKAKLAAGELDELRFRAVTFRAVYPNANCLRFRDVDLPAFATSFGNTPFLRDHESYSLEARGGTVAASALESRAFVMDVRLSAPQFIEAFLNGLIDRFSIAWNSTGVTCSVCGAEWLSASCNHWPRRKYEVRDAETGKTRQVLCELIFEGPTGREVSAVNTPAVAGTGVRGMLADLVAAKLSREDLSGVLDGGVAAGDSVAAVDGAGGQGEVGRMDDELTISAATSQVVEEGAAELLPVLQQTVLDNRLQASGLPTHLQDLVRESLKPGWRLAELDAGIERTRGAWAKLEAERAVRGVEPRAGGMLDSLDQITEAFTALIEGRRPKNGVRPLSGLREAYLALSGDYDMVGLFRPENVGLANVNSTTMANIVANVMNKLVVTQFQNFPRWWEPIVQTANFASLQQVKWVTVGGASELPTVAEGAAYQELSWDDAAETSDWVKKGGYLGISLEAMDKDDVNRLRFAPAVLAKAAWRSVGSAVAGLFTYASGVGPTLADTKALFHTDHGNLGTAALSATSWAAAKVAMRKQTEVNSAARLGALTAPRYLLVPTDLENTALTVLASGGLPGTANNDINPEVDGDTLTVRLTNARNRIIVVDEWTDVNDWAAVADPQMYPAVGLGYRYGETPEIFSVATPNSGLMFSNDTMPIKVRYFFACGVIDYRGLYKANVT